MQSAHGVCREPCVVPVILSSVAAVIAPILVPVISSSVAAVIAPILVPFISSSGDMAYDYGRATTTLADGTVVEGSYLVVWTKEDGEWKAAADIFN